MLAVLVQIVGYDPVAGAPVTLCAASHDDSRLCHLNGQTWWPTIAKLPTLRYDFFDGAFGGQITAPSSSLTLMVEPWPLFGRYQLADAAIRIWTGELGATWDAFTLRFDGRVSAQPALADIRADIDFAADDRWLDTALLSTYAGTTGVEGPATLKGQPKPLALGAPRYVAGTLIDTVNSVFQVSGYGRVNGFEAAMEKLARYGAPIGDAASFAALVAADVPAGRWATCNAQGLARLGAPPTGQISFLVQGDAAGPDGWARKPGQLIRRIAQIAGGAGKLDDASLNALDAATPFTLSVYLDQQTTGRELIQKIAASVNAVALVSWTGKLFVLPIGLHGGGVTLAADGSNLPPVSSVKQIDIDAPYQKLAIGAERAWTVHALGDIAFEAALIDRGRYDPNETYREGNIVDLADGSRWLDVATAPVKGITPGAVGDTTWFNMNPATKASDITYENGDTLEELKPAEAGADVTGNNTSKDTANVGGRPVADVIKDMQTNGLNALYATAFAQNLAAIVDAVRSLQDGSALTVQIANLTTKINDPTQNGLQVTNLIGAAQPDGNGGVVFVIGQNTALGTPGRLLGQTIDTIVSQVGGHDNSITALKEIVTGSDGTSSLKAMLTLSSDGKVTGYENTLDKGVSTFDVLTDYFRVIAMDGSGKAFTPFSIVDGVVTMLDVVVRKLSYEALVPLFGGTYNKLDPAGGFQKFPGGYLRQWGQYRATIAQEATVRITFPVPFLDLQGCNAIGFNNNNSNTKDLWPQTTNDRDINGCSFKMQAATGNAQTIDGFDWEAWRTYDTTVAQ